MPTPTPTHPHSYLPSLLPVPTSTYPRRYISLLLPIPIPTCHHPLKSTPTYPNGSLPPSTHPFQPLLYLPICTHFLKGISCSLLGTNTGYYILEKRNCIKILFFFQFFNQSRGSIIIYGECIKLDEMAMSPIVLLAQSQSPFNVPIAITLLDCQAT